VRTMGVYETIYAVPRHQTPMVMARDRIGRFMEPADWQTWLNNWLKQYVLDQPEMASNEEQAKHSLAKSRADVRIDPAKRGRYKAILSLRPNFLIEAIDVPMRLEVRLPCAIRPPTA